jgi:hypothetical protein
MAPELAEIVNRSAAAWRCCQPRQTLVVHGECVSV